MSTIALVCLAVVSGILGILNTTFNKLTGWKAVVINGLFVFSLIAFVQIVANLLGVNNAIPLFTTLAFSLLLLCEVTTSVMTDEDKLKPIIKGAFLAAASGMFALSAVSLAEFALLAFLGGLFAGLGFGLIVCATKKQKGLKNIIMNILAFACIGIFIGLSVNAVLVSRHLISSICMLTGGVLLLANKVVLSCGNGKTVNNIAKTLYSIGLIVVALSIYFY